MITSKLYPSLNRFSILSALVLFTIGKTQAQTVAEEDIYIADNGVFTIDTDLYYFGTGMVSTSRSGMDYGIMAFDKGSWQGASDANYVDGYAETMLNTVFTFPIGQSGTYAPVEVTPSTEEGVDAAYFRTNPATVGAVKNKSIQSLSTIEYWDIRSTESATGIALSWRPSSDLAGWLEGGLAALTIVGWDGSSWTAIPSTIDEVSFQDETTSMERGSIRSNSNLNVKAYSAFSLGGTSSLVVANFKPTSLNAHINKSHFYIQSNSRIKAFEIYDISGKKVASEMVHGNFETDQPFNHEEGVYIVKIEMEEGAVLLVKKIINKK